jgi:hypothetical protein
MLEFIRKIVISLLSAIISQAILWGCHAQGWYPDRDLAEWVMRQSPTPEQTNFGWWFLSTLLFGAVWFGLEKLRKRWQTPPLQIHTSRSPTTSSPPADSPPASEAKRDTKMHEALAYVELRQWGRKFHAIVSQPSANPEKGFSPAEVRQAAIDGDIRIWGRKSPHDAYVLIDPKYWETWQIDWFAALKSNAETEKRVTGAAGYKYYDLMVSRAEFERRWPSTPISTEPDWSFHDVINHFETKVGIPQNELDTVCEKLRSAARVGQITVWGRPKKPSLSMHQKPPKPLEPIPSDHWRDNQFDEVRCITHPDSRECRTEPDDDGHSQLYYVDIRFFRREILEKWKGN